MEWLKHCIWEPAASLGFPAQDFRISLDGSTVSIYFLSLLGALSPLPHHLSSGLIDSPAFYAFIAMLNRVFYRAFDAAWKSSHQPIRLTGRKPITVPSWLGLRQLISTHVLNATVQVEPGYLKVDIPSQLTLSDNAILGTRIFTPHARVRIVIHDELSAKERQKMLSAVNAYLGAVISVHWVFEKDKRLLGVNTYFPSKTNTGGVL